MASAAKVLGAALAMHSRLVSQSDISQGRAERL